MKKATLNIQLLNLIRRRAEKEPESLNMQFWMIQHKQCGTAGCLAGNAFLLKDRFPNMSGFATPVSIEESAVLAGQPKERLEWYWQPAGMGMGQRDAILGARLIFNQGEPLSDCEYPHPGLTPRSLLMTSGWPLKFQQAYGTGKDLQVTLERTSEFITSWLASGWPFINSLGEEITPDGIPT